MLQPNDIITVTARTGPYDPPTGASFVVQALSQYYAYVHWLDDMNYPLRPRASALLRQGRHLIAVNKPDLKR